MDGKVTGKQLERVGEGKHNQDILYKKFFSIKEKISK